MGKIVCGHENVKEFNQMLRAELPEFHALAKELYAAGMIDGLRGATIELNPVGYAVHTLPSGSETKHCENCRHWQRDKVGFGDGAGDCLINSRPRVMKWPKQTACEKFEVAK